MRQIILLITIVAGAATMSANPPRGAKLTESLMHLDSVVASREDYMRQSDNVRDSLVVSLGESPTAESLLEVAQMQTSVDSVLHYISLARRAGSEACDSAAVFSARIAYAQLLADQNLYGDALDQIANIDYERLDRMGRIKYYSILSAVNLKLAEQEPGAETRNYHKHLAVSALDSLITFFPEQSAARAIVRAQTEFVRGNKTLGAGDLHNVLDSMSPESPAYPIVTALLARYYKDNPTKGDEYRYYLSLSAASDVMNANPDSQSLVKLIELLVNDGDIDRAIAYLAAARDFAARSHSKTMMNSMLQSMATVSDAISQSRQRTRISWRVLGGVLFLALVLMVWLYFNQRRLTALYRKQANMRAEILMARETYIAQLLDLCSVYIESIEDYNRLVNRKLKANQIKDLLSLTESGKAVQDVTERFYTAFDAAVLRIFPGFVARLNDLLEPDKQIAPLGGDKLTPEQRIVAFMRLGVADSARIAKFLGLSLNTVYTYRNRVKSRAKNRDMFEAEVFEIGKND